MRVGGYVCAQEQDNKNLQIRNMIKLKLSNMCKIY